MLRTTSISLTGQESRRDRRYAAPPVLVSLGGDVFAARNWSLGGLLLDAGPAVTVGCRFEAEIQVEGRDDRFLITAEALRRDRHSGSLACRFVEKSPDLVTALDRAIAARFLRARRGRGALGAAVAVATVLAGSSALAGGPGVLIPGGAPALEFRLNFPSPMIEPQGPPTTKGDLQISLTSPDRSVIQFLFSPRSRFGTESDPETGSSRTYAGLSWSLFDNGGFFGNLSLAGSVTRPGPDELYRSYLGPPLAIHSTFELGYQLGDRHSLTLSFDRATAPDLFSERNEFGNLRLRYGLKF